MNHWDIVSQIKKAKVQTTPIFTVPVCVKIVLYTDKRSDIDNMATTIFDLLQKSGVVENDRLIDKLIVIRKQKVDEYITTIDIHELKGGDN